MCKLFLYVFVFIPQSVVSAFCWKMHVPPHYPTSNPIVSLQGDLEEIEQDVEEQIQIAIANGEFDNIEG